MRQRAWIVTMAVGVLGSTALAPAAWPQAAPATIAPPVHLDEALSLDPAVRVGRLPDGITYYIRKNGRPEKRVSLRLAVKAGSVLEDEDQRGLAHFLEHMSFNGSEHFKPGELVAYLESIGARFGADANAYTSFDETVYMLDVPTDKPGLVDKGLLALGDFAARATLQDTEIEKERGVVLEEWRLGQGAGSRIQRQQLPVLFHGSRYAERLPIGLPEVIRGFKSDRLRDFHRTWYRPERMALVAVGDVDPDAVEAAIKSSFADIPKSAGQEPLPVYEIPSHTETPLDSVRTVTPKPSMVRVSVTRPAAGLLSSSSRPASLSSQGPMGAAAAVATAARSSSAVGARRPSLCGAVARTTRLSSWTSVRVTSRTSSREMPGRSCWTRRYSVSIPGEGSASMKFETYSRA